MDAAAEIGRNLLSKHQIQPEYEDEQTDGDGTVKPVSRDQSFRRERGQGNINIPCSYDHEQDDNLTQLILTLARCDDHIYIHTYIHTYVHGSIIV